MTHLKPSFLKLFILLLALLKLNPAQSQCSGGAIGGSITPTLVFQTVMVVDDNYYTFAATAGTNYMFTFCQGGGAAGFDTQITILDNTGAYAGAYNDDYCGLSSEVVWVAPSTATYRVLINTFYCTVWGNSGTMAYREIPPAGPGVNCGNPYIIPSIPFSLAGQSTCGYGNDYTWTDACGSFFTQGEDFVFRYVAAGPMNISVTLSNTAIGAVGVFVTQGCPAGGTCIPVSGGGGGGGCVGGGGATNESWSGNPFGVFALPGAGTYYIMIDTWPFPNCTSFDINVTQVAGGGGGAGLGCYNTSNVTFNNDNYNTGTALTLSDDEFGPVVPITFPFCFMGTFYNNVVISSNSYLTFETTCAGQFSDWVTVAIPTANPNTVLNSVLGPWQDLLPPSGGTIRYNVFGSSPNRRFVATWRNVAMFSCNGQQYTSQIKLFETSNIIEIHIADKLICAGWNNGFAVEGIQDVTGTVAVSIAGRNNTQWTTTNEAIRFTPTCNPCANILPVGFNSFKGRNSGGMNILDWETSYELESKTFYVERSMNGQDFQTIGSMDGAGVASMPSTYHFNDASPLLPVSYYRIRALNENGDESVSEIIAVSMNESGLAIKDIFYDGSTESISLSVFSETQSGNMNWIISDALGRKLNNGSFEVTDNVTEISIPGSSLSSGCYFVTIHNGGSFKETRRFVKE